MHDRLAGTPDRLVGALDQLGTALGQHLDRDVLGHEVVDDELAHEVEVGLAGAREADLDLLEPHLDQGLEHAALAGRVHRVDQGLVAVPQIDRAPQGRPLDALARPGAVIEREGEREERPVLLERHLLRGHGFGRHRCSLSLVAVWDPVRATRRRPENSKASWPKRRRRQGDHLCAVLVSAKEEAGGVQAHVPMLPGVTPPGQGGSVRVAANGGRPGPTGRSRPAERRGPRPPPAGRRTGGGSSQERALDVPVGQRRHDEGHRDARHREHHPGHVGIVPEHGDEDRVVPDVQRVRHQAEGDQRSPRQRPGEAQSGTPTIAAIASAAATATTVYRPAGRPPIVQSTPNENPSTTSKTRRRPRGPASEAGAAASPRRSRCPRTNRRAGRRGGSTSAKYSSKTVVPRAKAIARTTATDTTASAVSAARRRWLQRRRTATQRHRAHST